MQEFQTGTTAQTGLLIMTNRSKSKLLWTPTLPQVMNNIFRLKNVVTVAGVTARHGSIPQFNVGFLSGNSQKMIECDITESYCYGQFSWIVACSAACINRLHRRINACGSADYSATWHRNRIDIGGLKMDSWRASVFATCVPIFGLAW